MQLLTKAVLAVAALSHCAAAAWTITPSDATQPDEIVGPHQTYVKVWTVTGSEPLFAITTAAAGPVFIDYDASLNAAPVVTTEAPTEAPVVTTEAPVVTPEAPTEAPVVTTDAPTEAPVAPFAGSGNGSGLGLPDGVVSFDAVASKVVAKVVFSGNCTKLLNEFEVVEDEGALKIQFKNEDFAGYGYVLAQIYVAEKEALTELVNKGSSGLYVSENVVTASNSSAAVFFKISGSGDIFVTAPATAYALKSLTAKISGDGVIQFAANSLTLGDSLATQISGDGEIAVVAKSVNVKNTISSKISGYGSIFVQAENVTAFRLKSKISGDGTITASTNGSCVKQDVAISGAGTVATGSIASVDTTIRMSGDGNVLVQTSGKLLVPREIYGKVQYVGTAPQQITDGRKPRPVTKKPKKPKHHHHHWWFSWGDDDDEDDDDDHEDDRHEGYYDSEDDQFHLPKSVTQASENIYETYEVRDVAPREPTFLVLELRKNWWGNEPNERIVISIFGVDVGGPIAAATTQAFAVRVQNQHPVVRGLFSLGFVAVALSAVVITFHKLVIGQRRREYQPLLQVVTSN